MTSHMYGILALCCLSTAWAAPHLSLGKGRGYGPYPGNLPFIGKGRCLPVEVGKDGFRRVTCYGPRESLAPGETRNVMVELADPYQGSELFAVVNMTAQLVDEELQPVPLSQVYVHHYVSRSEFLLGSGAELRGTFTRAPLKWPLTLTVNGTAAAQEDERVTNVQLINTVGVAAEDLRQCLECWCKDSAPPRGLPTKGSFFCCSNCPSASTAPARDYLLQYSVTYKPMSEAADANGGQAPQEVAFIGFDVTGGKIEYNLQEPLGQGVTHHETLETIIDEECPQKEAFTVVRCSAHQHVGSQCLSVYNMDKDGELICRSCPVYGTEEDVPGNEKGYVVAMTDGDVNYKVAPGTRIRVDSAYDGSERRLGLMGLMSMWVTGLDKSTCTGQFGHSYGYASAVAISHSATLHPSYHLEQPELSSS